MLGILCCIGVSLALTVIAAAPDQGVSSFRENSEAGTIIQEDTWRSVVDEDTLRVAVIPDLLLTVPQNKADQASESGGNTNQLIEIPYHPGENAVAADQLIEIPYHTGEEAIAADQLIEIPDRRGAEEQEEIWLKGQDEMPEAWLMEEEETPDHTEIEKRDTSITVEKREKIRRPIMRLSLSNNLDILREKLIREIQRKKFTNYQADGGSRQNNWMKMRAAIRQMKYRTFKHRRMARENILAKLVDPPPFPRPIRDIGK